MEGVHFSYSGGAKQPQCPKEKEAAIVEALKAFKMIQINAKVNGMRLPKMVLFDYGQTLVAEEI